MCITRYFSKEKQAYLNSLQNCKQYNIDLVNRVMPGCLNEMYFKDVIQYYDKLIELELNKQNQGKQIINRIDNDTYIRVLNLRYIQGLQWDNIANILCYSDTQIFRIHQKALQAFDDTEKMLTA